jgi:tetratricopeptide (TPR) repeat protein
VSRDVFEDAENWNHLALGGILLEQGRLDEASARYRTSLQSENHRATATAIRGMGDVAFQRGEFVEAKRLFLESLATYERVGTVWGIAETHDRLGYLACVEGQLTDARAHYQRALSLETRSLSFVLHALAGTALLHARSGTPERAIELLAFVRRHPATEYRTRVRRVDPLLLELFAGRSTEVVEAALAPPSTILDLDTVIRDALL